MQSGLIYYNVMKTALGILLAIALVIIFLQNLCKPPVKDATDDPAVKALIKAKEDTLALYRQVRAKDSAAINEAQQETAKQFEISEVYREKMSEGQRTIYKLVAKIEGARLEKKDSTWVAVSPYYVEGCDSLIVHTKELNNRIDDFEAQSAELNKLLHYEISIRDSALNNERNFNASFQRQLDECHLKLDTALKKKQPVQLYAGIGMLGNKINPLAGGQVNVSLRARNSMIYEVTGAMVGNTWYGGVGTKILIRLRK